MTIRYFRFWQILLQNPKEHTACATMESGLWVRRIEIALSDSSANQCCARRSPKSFCNSIGTTLIFTTELARCLVI